MKIEEGGDKTKAGVDRAAFSDKNYGSAAGFVRALRNASVSVFYQDRSMRVTWAHNVPQALNGGHISGLMDEDFLPANCTEMVAAAKAAVLDGGPRQQLEVHLDGNVEAEEHWFNFWIDPDVTDDGEIQGTVTTVSETTARKQREQTLQVLLREVSHRSRNMLAIIQGIANQTGRNSPTVEVFLAQFLGRLQSLASSQDLVTSSNWRGADLWDLILGQATRYVPVPARSLHIEGERPWLNPNASLYVGLALHELISNSVRFGALSERDGTVKVTARNADIPDASPLELTWRETVGGSAYGLEKAFMEERFGSVALEKIVPASLNGSAFLLFDDQTLEYRLIIPADNFAAR